MNRSERPWLDPSLAIETRVSLLLSRMTLEEKAAQMVQLSYSIITPEEADAWAQRGAGSFLHILGDNARRIQKYATETRLGIPVIFGIDAIHGHAIHNGATVFPTQLALASSWDTQIAEKAGEVTAKEVTAEGLHWTFSPVLCLGRDPRWGRIDETFGEDPYLAGQMGAAMIRGYQGKDPSHKDRIIACAKHYIAYGESTGGRDSYDSSVSMRTVRDIFLPPFEEAVKAGCLTFMAGYEPIDRLPCSAHTELLRGVLKGELGFSGFVVTDWSNTSSLMNRHRLANTMKGASKIAIEAGNDMIMTNPEFYENVLDLVREGTVPERLLDDAVARILTVKFKAGLFDVSEKVKILPLREDSRAKEDEAVFACDAHQKINLEAARKCVTLLKNNNLDGRPSLPIRGPLGTGDYRTVKTIAVIGPNADSVRAQFGDWTFFTHPHPNLGAVPTFHVTTMLEGITNLASSQGIKVLFDKGCDIFDPKKNSISRACSLAKKADIVFLAVGDTLIQTGEAHDRANLELSGAQNELAQELAKVCAKKNIPLVSILVNGKPLVFTEIEKASSAILETFNSGTLGGKATAEIIFNLAEPVGRLPISFPRTTGQIPVYYNQIPGWHEGSYYDCPGTPLFAFGEGLSYTSFRYDSLNLSKTEANDSDTVELTVTLTNIGKTDGTEVVQVYSRDEVASIVTPVRELRAFKKVTVKAGETLSVTIPLPVSSLSLVNASGKRVVESGEFIIEAGHDSRTESLISAKLTVI